MLPAGDPRMEWTLRLVGMGIDGQSRSFDVMTISRPDGLGDIANYWLRVLILGARRNIPSAVWICEIPGAHPSPLEIGCSINPGRSAVG